jgi:hypothetical protein
MADGLFGLAPPPECCGLRFAGFAEDWGFGIEAGLFGIEAGFDVGFA